MTESFSNNRMGTEVVGPGGILGWVQGAGSDHWGTSSQALALVECLLSLKIELKILAASGIH